ncbi:MAG: RNA 2'-phosphotransferase [Planctomycetaceae bacterium]|jgi:putative RNA 2'-phosphotransferase|nr:RNA 2'-phosphotransferase [Planctomycetaceae bacterium]MBT6485000.1 RNA 2'-phosphotransferase [Planctomycetaceae bacterium]MBT6497514.1 RNA 2'-phosphotransferase [Planctomycetaceae bacterium]
MNKNLISTSKFLSLILRHKPETIGMQLDADGWLDINSLIENANKRGNNISLELLHEVVAANDKQRFALSENGLRIRANQGHSLPDIDLRLLPTTPPNLLFHGTVAQFLPSIREQGLQKRSRNHVHLSSDQETATKVGMRRGKPVVLSIASADMHNAGYRFFLSANHVWLVDSVPIEFIEFP